ncbi:hypothetical protein [Methanopyrus sp.]
MLKQLWNSFAVGMGAAWILGLVALSIATLGAVPTLLLLLTTSLVIGVSTYRTLSPISATIRGAGLLALLLVNLARLRYPNPLLAAAVLIPLFLIDRRWFLAVLAASGLVLILRAVVEFHLAMMEVNPEYRVRVTWLAELLSRIWSGTMEWLRELVTVSRAHGSELRGSLTVWGKRLLRWAMS